MEAQRGWVTCPLPHSEASLRKPGMEPRLLHPHSQSLYTCCWIISTTINIRSDPCHICLVLTVPQTSLVAQLVKNLPAMQETPVWFLGWEDPLEKGYATHTSIHGLP